MQLIAPNHVRTTVFTNVEGRYEFPALQAGSYTLRVATPAPFKAYARERRLDQGCDDRSTIWCSS